MHEVIPDGERSLSELALIIERRRRMPGAEAELIGQADELVRLAQAQLVERVRVARSEGVSWQVIGDTLGVSRQAAFKRFGGAVEASERRETMSASTIDLIARTHGVFESLNSGSYEAVRAHMTYSCARVLNKRKVMGVWNQVLAATGRLESFADTTVTTPDGTNALNKLANRLLVNGAVVQTTLHHETGEWTGRVAYNGSGKITGLLIVPPGSRDLPF